MLAVEEEGYAANKQKQEGTKGPGGSVGESENPVSNVNVEVSTKVIYVAINIDEKFLTFVTNCRTLLVSTTARTPRMRTRQPASRGSRVSKDRATKIVNPKFFSTSRRDQTYIYT